MSDSLLSSDDPEKCMYTQYAISHPSASAWFLITWLPYVQIGDARDAHLKIIDDRFKCVSA